MDAAVNQTNGMTETANIALVGGGPAALVLAIGLARRGIRTTVFERDAHPEIAPRFNPDRSYTIDISGHGLKAIRHIDASSFFDERMIQFKGLKLPSGETAPWPLPGWTGSRGDIMRSLMAAAETRYRDCITFKFECRVNDVDALTGAVTYATKAGDTATESFDLIVGGDGAGSVVRKALEEQIDGFTIERKSFPNYVTMIELDRVGDDMDRNYLHGLSNIPFCMAGAIKGDQGSDNARWFCCVGTKKKMVFSSVDEARRFLAEHCPRILDLTSEDKIAAYAQRTCYHIGQKLTCSQLYGGKAVLLGDAGAPFPPIGQGINAAMESAMALDLCIAQTDPSPQGLLDAARRYNDAWKPEADAVSWISERSLFENRFHMLRSTLTMKLGLNIFEEAKSADIPYSEVRRKAKRLWPLWAA